MTPTQTHFLSKVFSKVAFKKKKVHVLRGELASLGGNFDRKRLPWGRSGVIGIKPDKLVAEC
jgi:hypothetical protein